MSVYIKITSYERIGDKKKSVFCRNITIYGLKEDTVVNRIFSAFKKNMIQEKEKRRIYKKNHKYPEILRQEKIICLGMSKLNFN